MITWFCSFFMIAFQLWRISKMITEELVELTHWILDKKTERQDLEIKAANGGCPKRLYDTLSSFSNQDGGGILFFGVDETQNFRLVGVYDLQDLKKRLWNNAIRWFHLFVRSLLLPK